MLPYIGGVNEVWVITTHEGHGENADVMGVYASDDAARRALEARPNMRVHVTGDGLPECDYSHSTPPGMIVGEPVDEHRYPHVWAVAEKYQVER